MRLRATRQSSGHRIAVVDDDPELLTSTSRLLELDGHEVRTASSGPEAVTLLRGWSPHLVLLDYYLGRGTGESVVRELRTFDDTCQVLLVTGYAADQPARKLLAELDIQGYHDKADGPNRLMTLVDAGLKHFRALDRLARQRAQLRHILEVSPRISRIQPVPELLEAALRELGGLLRGGDGFIATTNSGLFVLGDAAESISIRAATGRFAGLSALSELPEALGGLVRASLAQSRPYATGDQYVVVPLRTRTGDPGCMMVEAKDLPADAIEVCEIYARQVIQALENVLLYERATVDPLTGLFARDFGLQRLEEALRLGSRIQAPTSVLVADVDHFKGVNDAFGHAAGDLVLRGVGAAVRSACRTTDVAVRYGGEEILVVLPATDEAGALVVAERLRERVAAERTLFEGRVISTTVSVGVATARAGAPATGAAGVPPAWEPAHEAVRRADAALYQAKADGRNRVRAASPARTDAAAE